MASVELLPPGLALPRIAGASGETDDLPGPPSTSAPGPWRSSRPGSRVELQRVQDAFEQFGEQDGLLHTQRLGDLLRALGIDSTLDNLRQALYSVAGASQALTLDQTQAICALLSSEPPPLAKEASSMTDSPTKAPLKRVLTKNRYYLETGIIAYDEAVMQYINKLESHRRKCESEGRYQEAKVAAKRLADLKTAQVGRVRGELVANQSRELEEVHKVYEEETAKFHAIWDARIAEYESNFGKAVNELKAVHTQALMSYVDELQRKRPVRPRHSKDYLAHRDVQDKLAKAQLYVRASKVKEMADELYQAELEATLAAWEAESKLKIAKFQAKQQLEFEALLQRGAKGRDELELKRVSETERRTLRFRNIVGELETLHKLEVVHLENFLDGQVQAGKAVPLKDGFRRKRETLLSTAF